MRATSGVAKRDPPALGVQSCVARAQAVGFFLPLLPQGIRLGVGLLTGQIGALVQFRLIIARSLGGEHVSGDQRGFLQRIGCWTVTLRVPSGNVASTWTSWISSGTSSLHWAAVMSWAPASIMSATERPSRAVDNRVGDERDRFGVVERDAAREALAGALGGHRHAIATGELVSFARA